MSNVLIALLLSALLVLGGCMTPLPSRGGDPPTAFKTDGCTLAPEFNFRSCCVTHDEAYWRGGSCSARRDADKQLRSCIADAGHPDLAELYFLAVRVAGTPELPTPWRWGFGWPYGFGYSESCPAAH